MTPRDADPLTVEPEEPPVFGLQYVERSAGHPRLVRFREQRRRSRWNCSVALVALTLACLVFWAAVLFVAVNVLAGGSGTIIQARTADRGALAVGRRILTSGVAAAEPGQEGTRAAAGQPGRPPAAAVPAVALTYTGKLGYALPSHGSRYLAIRWPRGTVATLCGPADCVTRTSTDFGPVRSLWEAGRLADLSAVDFEKVCGLSPAQRVRFGLCPGTLLIVKRGVNALPETDAVQ